jgi:hypothetical protein
MVRALKPRGIPRPRDGRGGGVGIPGGRRLGRNTNPCSSGPGFGQGGGRGNGRNR